MINTVDKDTSRIIVMGDINYLEINWSIETSSADIHHPVIVFMECLSDTHLARHSTDPTHCHGNQTPNVLDLLLTNETGLISDIIQTVPLGKSGHVFIHFSLNCYTDVAERKTQRYLYLYNKDDYDKMWEEAQNRSRYCLDREDVDSSLGLFSNNVKHLIEKYPPKLARQQT